MSTTPKAYVESSSATKRTIACRNHNLKENLKFISGKEMRSHVTQTASLIKTLGEKIIWVFPGINLNQLLGHIQLILLSTIEL